MSTMTDEAEAIHGKRFDFSVEIAEGGRKLPDSKEKLTLKSNSIDCLGAWRKMRQGNGQCDLVEFCLFVGLLKESLTCDSFIKLSKDSAGVCCTDEYRLILQTKRLGFMKLEQLGLSAYLSNHIQLSI